ncbi:SDR family oxidoreductase [Sinomicrobium kalidii]|uniref:SDR family oxidoreductase n=1 Tax=Sinomicrobium kalidii TaxID=2900738 RepID=UPI001E65434E|nr:SDR family oxidoreductase [Sinomicrobium kalidii]UGU15460.1 SDR family oxidoreductase [Sinomicrobium kalidii]
MMKNVLITGANKGIGFEVAKKMAELGYFVFLGCRNQEKGTKAVQELQNLGLTNVDLLQMDVCDSASVRQAKADLANKIEVLDILINNAGIAGELSQRISEHDIQEIKKIFDTNFFGAIQATQQFLPLMQHAELPVIVNVSSELGSLGLQTSEGRKPVWSDFHAYAISKTALNAFTIQLADDLKGTKFKINSVSPGYTATGINNFAGFKTPEEGAEPIVAMATIHENEPTGQFFKAEGKVEW